MGKYAERTRAVLDAECGDALAENIADDADTEINNLNTQLRDISKAIGGVEYMDLPDGGDVSLADQVGRMRTHADQADAEIERLQSLLGRAWIFIDKSQQTLSKDIEQELKGENQ